MRRYLVVANRTLGGPRLEEAISKRVAHGPCHFSVVVPATPGVDIYDNTLSAYEGHIPDPVDLEAEARERLDCVLSRIRDEGADADGTVVDATPVDAALQALAACLPNARYDEIILSTLPPGASRWLAMDLVHRLERAVPVPVTHVYGPPAR